MSPSEAYFFKHKFVDSPLFSRILNELATWTRVSMRGRSTDPTSILQPFARRLGHLFKLTLRKWNKTMKRQQEFTVTALIPKKLWQIFMHILALSPLQTLQRSVLTFSLICSGMRSAWYVRTTGSQYRRPSLRA